MALPFNIPSFQKGSRLLNGSDVQKLSDLIGSAQVDIVAKTGGAKAGATQLNAAICVVDTVASDGDSVLLPLGYAGLKVIIVNNDAAQDIRVYGKGTDTINSIATGTGLLQGQQTIATYVCTNVTAAGVGEWFAATGAALAT